MNSLATLFTTILFSIATFFIYIVVSKSNSSLAYENSIKDISTLTKLPSISLSTPFIENRVKEYDDYSNDLYLGMKKDTYAGFVYAK